MLRNEASQGSMNKPLVEILSQNNRDRLFLGSVSV